VTRIFILYS